MLGIKKKEEIEEKREREEKVVPSAEFLKDHSVKGTCTTNACPPKAY